MATRGEAIANVSSSKPSAISLAKKPLKIVTINEAKIRKTKNLVKVL